MDGETPAEAKSFPSRHHRHTSPFQLSQPIIVFLTGARRIALHGSPMQRCIQCSGKSEHRRCLADCQYVIIADHLHLFAAPNPVWEGEAPAEPQSFDSWVRYWKSQFTKHHGRSITNGDRHWTEGCDGMERYR